MDKEEEEEEEEEETAHFHLLCVLIIFKRTLYISKSHHTGILKQLTDSVEDSKLIWKARNCQDSMIIFCIIYSRGQFYVAKHDCFEPVSRSAG